VGYAAASFRNCAYPTDSNSEKRKYLVIYAAGLQRRFHGVPDPEAPSQTLAVSVFDVLEQFARRKSGCVGLYLWVREDNPRAVAFYEKFGFRRDPTGPVQRDARIPHVTMRKEV